MSNVDPVEIQKFSAIAERWWDKNGEFKPLHDINPLRLDYIQSRCGDLKGLRVLDVGCGGGILAQSMAERGAEVTGLDLSREALKAAQQHADDSGVQLEYIEQAVEDLAAERAEQYDVVTCMEMLEHVPDPESVIRACAQLVKPGGDVVMSTLNRNPKSFLFAIVGAEYVLNLVPRGTHEYAKFIRPSELSRWARNAELDTQHTTGLHYNPVTKHYWLADNVDVNYLMHTSRAHR
ncbi:3-demethylubiquinone-9 3-O-methyltransferase [gamma proteobacterium HTCC5015]|nr:3-demethylubiquinone-9 3-O-methyltransferase [gamma proteobacterium HTCC5015]